MATGPQTSDEGQVIFSESGDLGKLMKSRSPAADSAGRDSIFELCRASCDRRHIRYEVLEHPGRQPGRALLMDFAGTQHTFRCVLEAHESLKQILFYVLAPESVPPEKRVAVMAFITRANYGMRIGNFEMDLDDGEVRYKTAIDLEHVQASNRLIDTMMGIALTTMDRYFAGVLRVVFGNVDPAEAIRAIEDR